MDYRWRENHSFLGLSVEKGAKSAPFLNYLGKLSIKTRPSAYAMCYKVTFVLDRHEILLKCSGMVSFVKSLTGAKVQNSKRGGRENRKSVKKLSLFLCPFTCDIDHNEGSIA